MGFQIISAIALVAFVSSVNCGCDRSGEVKPYNDGDVTQFFKNLGCDIKKSAEKVSDSAKPYIDDIKRGAEKISESAKPYIDEIGSSAKKFGGSVADHFNDLKDKISGNADNSTAITESSSLTPAENKPVEGSSSAASTSTSTSTSSTTSSPLSSSSVLPNVDSRVFIDIYEPKCSENQKNDGRGHCRPVGKSD